MTSRDFKQSLADAHLHSEFWHAPSLHWYFHPHPPCASQQAVGLEQHSEGSFGHE